MNNTDVNPDSKKKKPNLIRETTNYKNPPSNDAQFSQKNYPFLLCESAV